MSDPHPVDVLRAYVARETASPDAVYGDPQSLPYNASALLAHVERLEAALAELHLSNRDVFHAAVARCEGSTVEGLYAANGQKAEARLAIAIEALFTLGREITERRKG